MYFGAHLFVLNNYLLFIMSRFNPQAEMWRLHPAITKAGNIRNMFPGLGIAVAAFSVYCVGDFVVSSMTSSSSSSHAPTHAADSGHSAENAH